jgi:hypothetical protein
MMLSRDEINITLRRCLMETEDFVKCPLCHGLAQMRRSELLELLRAEDLRVRLEGNIDQVASMTQEVLAATGPRPGEFAQKVHNWEANLALWRRSAKE